MTQQEYENKLQDEAKHLFEKKTTLKKELDDLINFNMLEWFENNGKSIEDDETEIDYEYAHTYAMEKVFSLEYADDLIDILWTSNTTKKDFIDLMKSVYLKKGE